MAASRELIVQTSGDAELLYQLGDGVNKIFNEVPIQSAKKYRYVRYLSDKRYPADIAEMCWYEKGGDGHKLRR